jgi:nucleotide-binding universal stress UspA family protein
MTKKRRVFEQGHARKLLVIVDESPEVEGALFFAAGRVSHVGGQIVLLYVIEPDNQFWDAVRQVQLEEQTNKAKALFRLFRRKLGNAGYDKVVIEEVIREGKLVEAILQQIEDDEDVAVLILGASKETTGPGPLVSSLAAGTTAGMFPIPITIVPGDLNLEQIQALA